MWCGWRRTNGGGIRGGGWAAWGAATTSAASGTPCATRWTITHLPFVAGWRRFGAVTIDATRDVRAVGEELLLAAAMVALRRR
jgi:hypothetical protein